MKHTDQYHGLVFVFQGYVTVGSTLLESAFRSLLSAKKEITTFAALSTGLNLGITNKNH